MKKLWQRSRSRRRGSQSKTDATGAIKKSTSKENLPLVNGDVPPPVPVRSKERDNFLLKEAGKPGAGYKPMLVGISRPYADTSRPGTSGSLQNAVDQAADKVVQASSPDYKPSHTRTKSPRYIDIFSISNPKSSKLGYNEDIAERNLDLKKLVQDGPINQYAPTSKYQEEVAARNTPATEKVRASIDVARTTDPGEQARQKLPQRSSTVMGTYQVPNAVATADDVMHYNHSKMSAVSSPKQWPGQPRDKVVSLMSNTPVPSRPGTGQNSGQTAYQRQAAMNQARTLSIDTQTPDIQMIPPSAPQELKYTRSPPSSFPEYAFSRAEAAQVRPNERVPLVRGSSNDSVPKGGYEHRTGSALSNTSSVKRSLNLPNRTIMDLTGEDADVFSEEYAESEVMGSDLSRTPIIEEAREGYFHPVQPTLVSPIESIPEEHFPEVAQRTSEDVRPVSPVSPVDSPTPPASSFSTVNTVASMSPRKTVHQEQVSLPRNISVPTVVVQKPPASKLYTVAETEPEVEEWDKRIRKIPGLDEPLTGLPARNRSQPRKPDAFTFEPTRSTSSAPPSVMKLPTSAPPSVPKLPSQSPPVQTPQQSLNTPTTPANIQLSPESLKTNDFIDPSRSFGVLTRDFAVAPNKPDVPNKPDAPIKPDHAGRIDNEPNTSAKVRPTKSAKILNETMNGDVMHKTTKPVAYPNGNPRSSFNEEDFRRKQEQARAALVRLQQSLNEDFLNSPARQAQPTRSSKPRQAQQQQPQPQPQMQNKHQPQGQHRHHGSNDGRPVAPTSIFSQGREQHEQRTKQMNGYHKTKVSVPSIHEQVTQARPLSSDSATTIKPVRRNRSRSPNPPAQTYSVLTEARTRNRSRSKSKGKGKESEIEQRLAEIERLTQQMSRPYPQMLPQKSPRPRHLANEDKGPVPPSPGEVSLSSFPLPTPSHSRGPSEVTSPPAEKSTWRSPPNGPVHRPTTSASSDIHYPSQRDRMLNRRNSTRSQSSQYSSTSQFSIPNHLIPDRGSSMRDSLVREVEQES